MYQARELYLENIGLRADISQYGPQQASVNKKFYNKTAEKYDCRKGKSVTWKISDRLADLSYRPS